MMNRNPSDGQSMMRPQEALYMDVGRVSGACAGDPMRCDCGSLLARLVASGVELKCRRCKRIVVVPLAPE
jgi:hypothetical protein